MADCVARAVEEVEASIAEIVKGVEIADLKALLERNLAQLAAFKIGL